MVDTVVLFDNIYDTIMDDMQICKEDINFELRRFITDTLFDNPAIIGGDPDYHQPNWISSMDWEDTFHQIDIYNRMEERDYLYMKDLDKAKRDWFMFFSGATTLWQYGIGLTDISDELRDEMQKISKYATIEWNAKNRAQEWKPEVKEKCPLLVEFIDRLPFKVRGLVQFLGIAPHQKVYAHRDFMDSGKQKVHNITLSFMPDYLPKHLNVYDENNKKIKYFVKAIWFDENEMHSTDPLPYFVYSVKIDGIFDREELKNYGISI